MNYFSHQGVARVLDSLRPSVLDTPVLVVCVDNSGDAQEAQRLAGVLDAHQDGVDVDVELITAEANLGYGAGNNLAVAHALETGVEVIVICNPDTVFESGSLASLHREVTRGSPSIWGATTLEDGAVLSGLSRMSAWTCRGRPIPRRGAAQVKPGALVYPDGHLMAVSAQIWRATGGFSEDFFLYYEEADLTLRARERGIEVRTVPGFVVRHERGIATGSGEAVTQRGRAALIHASRSSVIFAATHRPGRLVCVVASRVALAAALLARGEACRSGWVLRGAAGGLAWMWRARLSEHHGAVPAPGRR